MTSPMHPSLRHLRLCACLALCLSGAYGQTGSLKFDHISLEEGLSQSTVNAVMQDGQGFPLVRHTGWTQPVRRLCHHHLQALGIRLHLHFRQRCLVDLPRRLRRYLDRHNAGRTQPVQSHTRLIHPLRARSRRSRSISENNVTAVFQDSRGTIWAGTLTGGLNRFDAATELVSSISGTIRRTRHHLRIMPSGRSAKTAGGPSGLRHGEVCADSFRRTTGKDPDARGRAGSFVRYRHDPRSPASVAGNNIRSLLADRTGSLWIGTWGNGLDRFELSTGRIHHYVKGGDPRTCSAEQQPDSFPP